VWISEGWAPHRMEKEGGVRCARSGIRMLPANCVQRRTPCLLPVDVSPFVGAQHAAHIAHAVAAGPGPVAYVLLVRGPSQGLVDPAVRVCVYRHVDR
jgi:hypothetical protein